MSLDMARVLMPQKSKATINTKPEEYYKLTKFCRFFLIFTAALLSLNPLAEAYSKNKAPIEEVKPEVNGNSVRFEAEWLRLTYKALLDFKSKQSNLRCFTVDISLEGKQLEVSFIPKGAIHRINDKIVEVEEGGRTEECGQGINYLVDLNGNIVKIFYSK